jgi:hypothetical protein
MKRCGSVAAGRLARTLRVLTLLAAGWVAEASAETFVILFLVGDHLTVVAQRRQTGSHMDVNEYQVVPMTESTFDDFAVRVADATIAKLRPDAGSVTLRADAATYKLRDSWLDADMSGVADVISAVKKQIPVIPDVHLLLITPYRDQPALKTRDFELGAGKVSGLGFYIDTATTLYRSDTHESSRGYLGIFANYQLVLIDLQSGAVKGHERVVLGTTRSSARAEDRTPWNALTAAQKIQILESLLKEGIEDSLPKMLTAQKP